MGVLVYGIGINDKKYPTSRDRKRLKEYNSWKSMLFRCTEKAWQKKPSYVGTTCSENFKHYSFFYEGCQSQVGFSNIDEKGKCWQLDKDLLVKGNKHYSENTCVFVPPRLNLLTTNCLSTRGELPVGVCWNKGYNKFQAGCSDTTGKSKYLGVFDTIEEAFLAYKAFKEALIKEVANEYKNVLDNRVYQALTQYEVEITD